MKIIFWKKYARHCYISPWLRNQWATQVLLSTVSASVKYSRITENQWLCSDSSVCSIITLGLSCSSRCNTPQAAPLIATCELIYFHSGLFPVFVFLFVYSNSVRCLPWQDKSAWLRRITAVVLSSLRIVLRKFSGRSTNSRPLRLFVARLLTQF